MKDILLRKFNQNSDIAVLLSDTGDKQLHEASADQKWAIGAELASKACLTTTWTGQDILGLILEEVREELKSTPPTQSDQSNFEMTGIDDTAGLNVSSAPMPDDDYDPSIAPINEHVIDTDLNNLQKNQSKPKALAQARDSPPPPSQSAKGNATQDNPPHAQSKPTSASPAAPAVSNEKEIVNKRSRAKKAVTQPGTSVSTTNPTLEEKEAPPPRPPRAARLNRAQSAQQKKY